MGNNIPLSEKWDFTLPTTNALVILNRKQIQEFLTLDNIFRYASEDELRAIVSSIIGRLWLELGNSDKSILHSPTDKDIAKIAKELRDVK